MTAIPKPRLIVFEGIDGSGKTTLSKLVYRHMKEKNLPVIWLREPSDSKWGRKIKKLSKHKTSIPVNEELNYFIKDRRYNVSRRINPALEDKVNVVLDRYYYSTACYQGARGLDMESIIETNRAFAPEPDITFIIDVPVETGLKRIRENREAREKLFEQHVFLEKVRQNYLSLSGKNIHIIDGRPDPKIILKQILRLLKI